MMVYSTGLHLYRRPQSAARLWWLHGESPARLRHI